MPVTYFEYPWQGSVYAVDVEETELRSGRPVKLPDGNLIMVTVLDGYFPKVEKISTTQESALPTRVVIAKGNFQMEFDGNWELLTELINAAAAVNTLFSIRITMEEYKRLESGGLAQLKEKLSSRAYSLISLEEDTWNGGGPAVELLRTCGCR